MRQTWRKSVASLPCSRSWLERIAGAALFPIAGELQGALADGFAEGLVGREGVEPFGLRLALVSQEVNQTQGLTLRSQLQNLRPQQVVLLLGAAMKLFPACLRGSAIGTLSPLNIPQLNSTVEYFAGMTCNSGVEFAP